MLFTCRQLPLRVCTIHRNPSANGLKVQTIGLKFQTVGLKSEQLGLGEYVIILAKSFCAQSQLASQNGFH